MKTFLGLKQRVVGRAAALLTTFETNLSHHVASHDFMQDCQVGFLLILEGQDSGKT